MIGKTVHLSSVNEEFVVNLSNYIDILIGPLKGFRFFLPYSEGSCWGGA